MFRKKSTWNVPDLLGPSNLEYKASIHSPVPPQNLADDRDIFILSKKERLLPEYKPQDFGLWTVLILGLGLGLGGLGFGLGLDNNCSLSS